MKLLPQRLKELYNGLQCTQQGQTDLSSLITVAKGLLHHQLIHHKDTTTSILTSCCIVEFLRLYAPNTPYDNGDLHVIFNTIISQLGNMGKTGDDNFKYHIYLLESLSTAGKAIRIMTHLDQAETMTAVLFSTFFDHMLNELLPPKVQECMTDLLTHLVTHLVEEMDNLPPQIMELLIINLIGDNGEAGNKHMLAVDLCRASLKSLQKWIMQLYIDTMITAEYSGDEQMDDQKKLHDWIQKIYITMPSLLSNLISQLQEGLTSEELDMRCLAMETSGMMLVNDPSTLLNDYPGVWNLWLERSRDISVLVRMRWIELASLIYQHNPEATAANLNEKLVHVLSDPDGGIRASTCESIGNMDITIITSYMTTVVLEQLSMRCRDRKKYVQETAMEAMGRIYNQAYSQMDNEEIGSKFGWIPGELFRCLYPGDRRLDVVLDIVLQTHVFPENVDDHARMERLVTAVMYFNEKASNAFDVYIARGKRHIEMMQDFIDYCSNKKMASTHSARKQKSIKKLTRMIAEQFDKRTRMISFLGHVRGIQDNGVVQLLRTSINIENECQTIMGAQNSLLELMKERVPTSLESYKWILNRTHLFVVNKSLFPCLCNMLKSANGTQQSMDGARRIAVLSLVKRIGTIFPEMGLSDVGSVLELIGSDNNDLSEVVNVGLEVLSSMTELLPTKFMLTSQNIAQLWSYATQGSILQAERATTILCTCDLQDTTYGGLIDDLLANLSLENPNLPTVLVCMSVFALHCPLIVQQYLEIITSFIQQKCMAQTTRALRDDNPLWQEHDGLKTVSKQKLAAIRILPNYLIGMVASNQNVESEFLEKVIVILQELMESTCGDAIANDTSAAETSYLRVLAGNAMVQLAEHWTYSSIMDITQFEQLGLLMQDPCYFVRRGFAEFLMSGISSGQISPLYLALLVLCAYEPEEQYWEEIRQFLRSYSFQKEAGKRISIFPIDLLIHLLAHHPDFETCDEDLCIFSNYINFWIECLVTRENITYFYHYIRQIKPSVDAINENYSEGSYVLCDLACLLLSRTAEDCYWKIGPMQSWIKCDSQAYTHLSDGPRRKQVSETNFISQELAAKLKVEDIWKKEKGNLAKQIYQAL